MVLHHVRYYFALQPHAHQRRGPLGWSRRRRQAGKISPDYVVFTTQANLTTRVPVRLLEVGCRPAGSIGPPPPGPCVSVSISSGAWQLLADTTAGPCAEQHRIVRLLDAAEELRRLRRQADRRTAELVPAIFHEMFGDPATNPKGWPIRQLGKSVELVSGGTPSKERSDFWDAIPWVSPKDMKVPEIVDAEDHVGPAVFEETALKMTPTGFSLSYAG